MICYLRKIYSLNSCTSECPYICVHISWSERKVQDRHTVGVWKKKSTLPLNCFVQNGRINIAHVIQSYHEIKTKVIMGKAICLMSLCTVLVCMQLFYFDVFDRLKVSIAYTIVSFESHKSFTPSWNSHIFDKQTKIM